MVVTRAKAEKMSPEEMAGKMVIGKLFEVEGRPEFTDEVYALMSAGEGGLSSEARLVS
jgi:hypothetical protein